MSTNSHFTPSPNAKANIPEYPPPLCVSNQRSPLSLLDPSSLMESTKRKSNNSNPGENIQLPSLHSLDLLTCHRILRPPRFEDHFTVPPLSPPKTAIPTIPAPKYHTTHESISQNPSRNHIGPNDWITWVPPEARKALKPESIPTRDSPSQSQPPSSPRSKAHRSRTGRKKKPYPIDSRPNHHPPTGLKLKATRSDGRLSTGTSSSSSPSPTGKGRKGLKPGGGPLKDFFPPTRHLSFSLDTPFPLIQTANLNGDHPFSDSGFNYTYEERPSSASGLNNILPRPGSLAAIRRGSDPSILLKMYNGLTKVESAAFPFPIPQTTDDRRIPSPKQRKIHQTPVSIDLNNTAVDDLSIGRRRSSTQLDMYKLERQGDDSNFGSLGSRPNYPFKSTPHSAPPFQPAFSLSPTSTQPQSTEPSQTSPLPQPISSLRCDIAQPSNYSIFQRNKRKAESRATSVSEAARLGAGREVGREERRRIYAESGCPIRGKGIVLELGK